MGVRSGDQGGDATQKATLDRLEKRLTELPVLPAVLLELLRLDPRSDKHYEEVSRLIGHDPAMATRVIRAANSAANSRGRRILHLGDAIGHLGSVPVANLVIADTVARVFVPRQDWERSLWVHAVSVAVLARALGRDDNAAPLDIELCYLAGLLHDIGRFILYLEAPADLRSIDESDWHTPEELIAAERRICGFTHAELGHRAALLWGLPSQLATIIHHHHARPPLPHEVDPELRKVIEQIQVADRISLEVVRAPDWPNLAPATLSTLVARLPPSTRPLEARQATLAGAVTEIAGITRMLGLAR
jgi:putative nucleotidyltransferase with HDIG domain